MGKNYLQKLGVSCLRDYPEGENTIAVTKQVYCYLGTRRNRNPIKTIP